MKEKEITKKTSFEVKLKYDNSNDSLKGKHLFYPISFERQNKDCKKGNYKGDIFVKTLQNFRKEGVSELTIGIMDTLQVINDYIYLDCKENKEINENAKKAARENWCKQGLDWYEKNAKQHIERELTKHDIKVNIIYFDQFDKNFSKERNLEFIDIEEHKEYFKFLMEESNENKDENTLLLKKAYDQAIENLINSIAEDIMSEYKLEKNQEEKVKNYINTYLLTESPVLRWMITSKKFDGFAFPEGLDELSNSIANTVKEKDQFKFITIEVKVKEKKDTLRNSTNSFYKENNQSKKSKENNLSSLDFPINIRDEQEMSLVLALLACKRKYEKNNTIDEINSEINGGTFSVSFGAKNKKMHNYCTIL